MTSIRGDDLTIREGQGLWIKFLLVYFYLWVIGTDEEAIQYDKWY